MKKSRWVNWIALGAFCAQVFLTPIAQVAHAEGWPLIPRRATTVEQLARHVDCLERHIDEYGSVTAKVPDVWGEERLTAHRWEFEQEMAQDLGTFTNRVNASIRRADSAFLASATAISAALGAPSTNVTSRSLIGGVKVEGNSTTTPATTTPGTPATTTETGTAEAGITPPTSVAPFEQADGDISSLEPQIHLDQKARYLNHLHELRRINEGDDTKDLPGYALNLIRVPVSVMPGRKTRIGHGAEITMTVTPQYGDQLLPITFRQLATNDLVNQFTLSLVSLLNDPDVVANAKLYASLAHTLETGTKENGEKFSPAENDWWYHPENYPTFWGAYVDTLVSRKLIPQADIDARKASQAVGTGLSQAEALTNAADALTSTAGTFLSEASMKLRQTYAENAADLLEEGANKAQKTTDLINTTTEKLKATKLKIATESQDAIREAVMKSNVDFGRAASRNAQLPFPVSYFSTVYGQSLLLQVGVEAHARVPSDPERGIRHYHDVEAYVREEMAGAYEMLGRDENVQLWQHCTPALARGVRTRQRAEIDAMRLAFFNDLCLIGADSRTSTGAFTWAIIVEAALLNERLIEDMREVATSHGCHCLPTEWMPFFQPKPMPEACETFNTYVKCRWPIHVFHVDPVTQEQNVADEFSSRRELQLSLAVAVSQGQISLSQANQFQRKLELDINTIALNRTIVGFSHGEDTFGYRFQPRVQTPDTESNMKVAFRETLLGGPNRDELLRDHRIEPGMRECVALVIAPAFIRQYVVDVHSDWFKLAPCDKALFNRNSKLSASQTVDLSRDIRCMQEMANVCQEDANLYRDGEVYRLLRRVDQLSKELPMQTMRIEVPVSQRIGGWRLLQPGGNFDRSPQLYSWYGAPGIDTTKETTLYLAGENFRLQGTRVLVGGKGLEDWQLKNDGFQYLEPRTRLINDAVLEVRIPDGANTFKKPLPNPGRDGKPQVGEFVEIRIATFHGVSGSIEVPVIQSPEKVAAVAAGAAAKKVVDSHVALKHIDRFQWGIDTIDVELVLDENRHVVDVNQLTDTSVVSTSDSPFQDELGKGRFRGWVFSQLKEAAVGDKPDGSLPMELTFNRGLAPVVTPIGGDSLLATGLEVALKGTPIAANLETLEIVGFLKFYDERSKVDAQPTIQIENRLKLKITQVKVNEKKAPAAVDPAVPAVLTTPSFEDFAAPDTAPSRQLDTTEQTPAASEAKVPRPFSAIPRPLRSTPVAKWAASGPQLGSGPIQRVSGARERGREVYPE